MDTDRWAPPPAQPELKKAAPLHPETPRSPTTVGYVARAYVVHGVRCRRPMTHIIQEVETAFGRKGGEVIGVRWLLDGGRRRGKAASSLVVFLKRAVPTASEMSVRIRGRKHTVVEYEWERGPAVHRSRSSWIKSDFILKYGGLHTMG